MYFDPPDSCALIQKKYNHVDAEKLHVASVHLYLICVFSAI